MREFREETGLSVELSPDDPEYVAVTRPGADGVSYEAHYFLRCLDSPCPLPESEVEKGIRIAWQDAATLMKGTFGGYNQGLFRHFGLPLPDGDES